MREQIEVIYESGVLRPVAPLSEQFREHQHYTLTLEGDESGNWLKDADPSVDLEAVRQALAKASLPLAQ
jgi:predicted DNA-binding antitoxin AbrB/MazE fold protein